MNDALLGEKIHTWDDKYGKKNSWEAEILIDTDENGSESNYMIHIVGYGETEKDAIIDLKSNAVKFKERIKGLL